jgi:hypothetical protein
MISAKSKASFTAHAPDFDFAYGKRKILPTAKEKFCLRQKQRLAFDKIKDLPSAN